MISGVGKGGDRAGSVGRAVDTGAGTAKRSTKRTPGGNRDVAEHRRMWFAGDPP